MLQKFLANQPTGFIIISARSRYTRFYTNHFGALQIAKIATATKNGHIFQNLGYQRLTTVVVLGILLMLGEVFISKFSELFVNKVQNYSSFYYITFGVTIIDRFMMVFSLSLRFINSVLASSPRSKQRIKRGDNHYGASKRGPQRKGTFTNRTIITCNYKIGTHTHYCILQLTLWSNILQSNICQTFSSVIMPYFCKKKKYLAVTFLLMLYR